MQLNKTIYKEYNEYPIRILQVGEGNFLRAFSNWIIDKMNREIGFNSGVVVLQPRGNGNGKVHLLNKQDGLYTHYMRGIKDGIPVSEYTVNNSIRKGINSYTHYDEYLMEAENPELRFVISNTTEAGIVYNEGDRLEDRPQFSFPGKLAAFLYHRYQYFNGNPSKGLVFIPCELIDENGKKLKEIILKLAKNWNLEEGFISWIQNHNTFCNSLVDRIVPGYPKERIEEVQQELGYQDEMVVESEQFHLWVIEGPRWLKEEFPAHRAGLNVMVVDDMTPYRTRKVRILNGAHTSMVPVAYLYGCETVKESVENEVVGKFIEATILQEIIPTLDLPKEELKEFAMAVIDRFRNPYIKHYLMSIALNSISKFETRVLPSILEFSKRKKELPTNLVFAMAALIIFYKGKRGNEEVALADDKEILDFFGGLWRSFDGSEEGIKAIVTEILSREDIWKLNLNEVDGLNCQLTSYITKIEKLGLKNALLELI